MDHRLKGVRWKIRRAERQLNALNRGITQHLEGNAYSLVGDFESEASEDFVIRVHAERPVSPNWPVMIGDIAHNLRSALDHLAWQLAGPNPPTKTGFPIFLKSKDYNRSRGPGSGHYMVRGMSKPAKKAIRDLQPDRRAKLRDKTANSDPLWLLHELNRVDKHQLLQVAAFNLEIVRIKVILNGGRGGGYFGAGTGPLKSGDEVHRRWISGLPHPKVEIKSDFEPDIAFAQPGPAYGLAVVETLRDAGHAIVRDVLPKLDPLLPPRT